MSPILASLREVALILYCVWQSFSREGFMRCLPRVGGLLAVVLALTVPLRAIYVMFETSQVPIERLAANIERERQKAPKSPEHAINLARLYAMGYALKVHELPAATGPD